MSQERLVGVAQGLKHAAHGPHVARESILCDHDAFREF